MNVASASNWRMSNQHRSCQGMKTSWLLVLLTCTQFASVANWTVFLSHATTAPSTEDPGPPHCLSQPTSTRSSWGHDHLFITQPSCTQLAGLFTLQNATLSH